MLKHAAESHDMAALVQVVREYQQSGQPLPSWLPVALEAWLDEFLALAIKKKRGPRTQWARKYRRRVFDAVIADHLECRRKFYGLTWAEAADEAADYFAETPAAGSMMDAYKRDKRAGLQRPWTHYEDVMIDQKIRRLARLSWSSLNAAANGSAGLGGFHSWCGVRAPRAAGGVERERRRLMMFDKKLGSMMGGFHFPPPRANVLAIVREEGAREGFGADWPHSNAETIAELFRLSDAEYMERCG
jgi:hypothetical protein